MNERIEEKVSEKCEKRDYKNWMLIYWILHTKTNRQESKHANNDEC